MPVHLQNFSSLAGINPGIFFFFPIDGSQYRQLLLAILRHLQEVPFFTSHDLQIMTMRSGTLKFLLQCLTRSDNTRLSFRFTGMIHKRILNRMIGEIGVPQIQRCMCIISS
jgi:hypothetical protein